MRARIPAIAAAAVTAALLAAPTAQGALVAPDAVASPTVTELQAPVPDWFTPELAAEVSAAAVTGDSVPLPSGVELPASALLFTGIRPGSWILSPAGCTANFVFGTPANWYIGTAGHCTRAGETVTIVALPGVLMDIGTTVVSVDGGVGNDFALIDVAPAMEQYVNPSAAYFGGPTGAQDPALGDVVVHAGHGLVVGTGGTPRAGVVTFTGTQGSIVPVFASDDTPTAYGWDGVSAPGDSGSFVQTVGGAAVGDLTHLVVGTAFAPAFIAGTTISRMIQIGGQPLATAPLGPDPT